MSEGAGRERGGMAGSCTTGAIATRGVSVVT